jgi:hypothetical protein
VFLLSSFFFLLSSFFFLLSSFFFLLSSFFFVLFVQQKQVITINTQSGFSTRKLRGKLTPEEPANGKYEYQEQQLQKYLMRRYVNNNWCCKHFAPPHPDCGLWGNYDANTQGWCCWGCKTVLPISLFLLVLSYAMLSAAATSDYIISMNLNEQEENIFCSRLNTTATSSVVTLFPCTGTSLSSLTMKVSTYNKVDALVDGVMDSEVASAFQITDRAQQLRLVSNRFLSTPVVVLTVVLTHVGFFLLLFCVF